MPESRKIEPEDGNLTAVRELLIQYREEKGLTGAEMATILLVLHGELLWAVMGEKIKDITKEKSDA